VSEYSFYVCMYSSHRPSTPTLRVRVFVSLTPPKSLSIHNTAIYGVYSKNNIDRLTLSCEIGAWCK